MKKQKNVPELRFSEFTDNWSQKKLREVCTKIQDGNYGANYPSANEFLKSGIPFLTSKAINQDGLTIKSKIDYISKEKNIELKKAHLQINDVLFTNRGANVGVIGFVDQEIANGNIGPQLTLLRSNNHIISPLFLKYCMNTYGVQKQINSQDSGSAMNFFGIGDTEKFKVHIPTIPEQEKITSFLSAVDKKLTQLRRKKELLETYKRGLMQKLFSQQIRFKQDDGSAFPDWKKTTLGKISEKPKYGLGASATKFDGKHKYLRITDIDENTHCFSPNPLTSPDSGISPDYCLKENDIVFARTGASVGKTYLYNKNDGEIYFAGYLVKFSIKNAIPKFIYYLTLSEHYFKWVLATSMRTGQPGINADEYSKFSFYLPIVKEQQKIADCLTALDKKIEAIAQQIHHTDQFKKGLLQKMFV